MPSNTTCMFYSCWVMKTSTFHSNIRYEELHYMLSETMSLTVHFHVFYILIIECERTGSPQCPEKTIPGHMSSIIFIRLIISPYISAILFGDINIANALQFNFLHRGSLMPLNLPFIFIAQRLLGLAAAFS